MKPLKNRIFEEVRKTHLEIKDLDDKELNALLFYSTEGFRLTYSGFIILKKIFTAYSFEIPMTIKTKHRYAMSKIEFPYFFTKSRIILFSEMDASMVKLHGDVQKFLEKYTK